MFVYAVVRALRSHTQVVSLHHTERSAQAACEVWNRAHKRGTKYTITTMTVHN